MNRSRKQIARVLQHPSWVLTFAVFALFITGAAFIFKSGSTVLAATGINEQFNYQGRLLTNAGATVPDGNYNMRFKLYQDGDGVAGGGDETLEWTETRQNSASQGVVVKNGYFSVYLGSVTPFGSSVDWNQDTLWLSMEVTTDGTTVNPSPTWNGEMTPFKRLGASPYAINTKYLGGLTSSQFVQLAQGVQADATTASSIFLNKTGASGNILQLQKNGSDVMVLDNSGNWGIGGLATVNVSSNRALFVGPNAISNPAFQVDTSAASSATGVIVSSKAATNGVNLAAISSGTDEDFSIDAKGSGALNIGNISTGNVLIAGGSSSTGCTVTNSTGALACTAGLSGTTGGFSSTISASNFSGSSSGTNTGDQTSVTGNAGTATALQTARNINGVSFNGTADITVTAAAGTLTGATLASGVTASSLTSLGTLTGLAVSGTTTLTSTSASAFVVGANGATNPALRVDASTASSATGLLVTSKAAAAGVTLAAISSGTNEAFSIDAKGSGALNLGNSSTGNILLGGGSGSTGCTVTNSSGAFACTAGLSGTTGTFSSTLSANGGLTVAANQAITMTSGTGTHNQTFTGTTTTASTITASSLTSGKGLSIASASTALTSGNLLNVALSGAATVATDYVVNFSNTSATSTAGGLFVSNNGTGNSFRVDDATGDTTPFIIDAAGKVGIGTATPITNLQIVGQAVIGTGGPFMEAQVAGFTGLSINKENNYAAQAFQVASETAAHSGAFFGVRSRGTFTSPTATNIGDTLFLIAGVGYTSDPDPGPAPANLSSTVSSLSFVQDAASTDNTAPSALVFSAGGSERMRIKSTGLVSIGDNTSTSLFGVSGNSNTLSQYVAQINEESNAAGSQVLMIRGGQTSYTAPSTLITFRRYDGTNIGSVQQNSSSSVAFNTTSDARLKENIVDSTAGLDIINQIKVREYSYISDGNHTMQQGMIAQELYDVYGQAVTVGGDDANESPWAIDYGKLTPLLVKGMQDLDAKHEDLRTEFDTHMAGLEETESGSNDASDSSIAQLTSDLGALGDRVTSLENQVGQLGAGFANGGIVTGDAEFQASVMFAANVTFQSNTTFNGTIALNDDIRGVDVTVPAGTSTKVITFAQAQSDNKYAVQCTPGWNTNCYVTNKTKDGFTLNFTTPVTDEKLDWLLIR